MGGEAISFEGDSIEFGAVKLSFAAPCVHGSLWGEALYFEGKGIEFDALKPSLAAALCAGSILGGNNFV